MDVLRNLFGNLSAGIIRLLVTVGILAAVYFFVVKPTLDTTTKISHEVNGNIQKGFKEANIGDIGKTINDVNRKVQREIKKSLRQSKHHGAANQLIDCIQRAHQDVDKIQRCTEKY
jgi:predicted PurR-regulated permease PerM